MNMYNRINFNKALIIYGFATLVTIDLVGFDIEIVCFNKFNE